MKSFLIWILILILNFIDVRSNVIGIDFGTEFIKITVLKPNSAFRMVENIQSKTKTPFALAFKDEERLFGDDALGKKVRFPKQVFVSMHEFLGKRYNSKQVKKFIEDFFISYETEEDKERKTFNFKVNFNKENYLFSTEEIFGMLFRYIKFLAEKYSESTIKDCIVTVPAYFGFYERLAISQAVELSNLKLQGLITENTAAAVQYSLDKQFNKTENIIFYNMGSGSSQATLVSYLSVFEKKNNITTEIKRKIEILAESWDKFTSGNRVNYNFIRYLMNMFDNLDSRKNKQSVLKDYRIAERLLPSVLKYKEILSANKLTPINILGVDNGQNLEGKVERETFEEFNKDVLERIFLPIEKVLNISGLNIEDITQVELLGGSVRIPKIQEILKSKLNPSLIGQHMNGDDSMAFGACFVAANMSNIIKAGKKIELNHGTNYGIKINIKNIDLQENSKESENKNKTNSYCIESFNSSFVTNECVRHLDTNKNLFSIRNLPNSVKKVSVEYDNEMDIRIYQYFDVENMDLEENTDNEYQNQILNFKVRGVKKAIEYFAKENITSLPKIELKFELDSNGLLTLKAQALNYVNLYLNIIPSPTGGNEFIFTPEFIEPYNKTFLEEEIRHLNESGANNTLIEMMKMKKEIGKKRIQELKKELTVDVEYIGVLPMNANLIQESRKRLESLDQFDEQRIKIMDARNNLESEIYKRKEWLESEESLNFIKPEESELVFNSLKEITTWYEEEGYIANLSILLNKMSYIEKKFSEIDKRKDIENRRGFAIEKFNKELKNTYEEAKKILFKKPWVEEYYNNTLLKDVSSIETWFVENLKKQSNLKAYDITEFTEENIDSKIRMFKRLISDLNKIQKPKPPIIDTTYLELEEIQELLKNGTLALKDFIKSEIKNNITDSNNAVSSNSTSNDKQDQNEKIKDEL